MSLDHRLARGMFYLEDLEELHDMMWPRFLARQIRVAAALTMAWHMGQQHLAQKITKALPDRYYADPRFPWEPGCGRDA